MIVKVLVNDLINKFIWSKVLFNHINQNEVWEKGKFCFIMIFCQNIDENCPDLRTNIWEKGNDEMF